MLQTKQSVDQLLRLSRAQHIMPLDCRLTRHRCHCQYLCIIHIGNALLCQPVQNIGKKADLCRVLQEIRRCAQGIFLAEFLQLKAEAFQKCQIAPQYLCFHWCQLQHQRCQQPLRGDPFFLEFIHKFLIQHPFMCGMLVNQIQAIALLHNPIGAKDLPDDFIILEKRLLFFCRLYLFRFFIRNNRLQFYRLFLFRLQLFPAVRHCRLCKALRLWGALQQLIHTASARCGGLRLFCRTQELFPFLFGKNHALRLRERNFFRGICCRLCLWFAFLQDAFLWLRRFLWHIRKGLLFRLRQSFLRLLFQNRLGNQHRFLQCLRNRVVEKFIYLIVILKANLQLRRMHIHIHLCRLNRKIQHENRKFPNQQLCFIRILHRSRNHGILNKSAVDEKIFIIAVRAAKFGLPNQSADGIFPLVVGNGEHAVCRILPVNIKYRRFRVIVPCRY